MNLELLNTIIKDLPEKDGISDGVSTFGELHNNLLSLYINFLDLLEVIYSTKGVENIYWISKKDSKGEELLGYMHLGIFEADTKLQLGLKIPVTMWKLYESKAKILSEAPDYKSLYKSLPNYFYDAVKVI